MAESRTHQAGHGPAEIRLYTRWGKEAASGAADPGYIPLPEYPRPQLVRPQFTILNGWWEYRFLKDDADAEKGSENPDPFNGSGAEPGPSGERSTAASGRILVPFSPETALSGVGRVLQPGEVLRYERALEVPELRQRQRLLLHFGAVDERCVVRLNGHFAGSHSGGYTAFTCDITGLLEPGENRLTVDVRDDSDTSFHARGKQKLAPAGMFYQAQSGIWKTVWCEWVPERHIGSLRFEADPDAETVTMIVRTAGPAPVGKELLSAEFEDADGMICRHVFDMGKEDAEQRFTLPVPSPRLWSPEDPYLYTIRVTLGQEGTEADGDAAESYFAVRSIGISDADDGEKTRNGAPRRILLNGKPYFMHGVLDQGYWPESLLTPPADEALVWDIENCRELGFNMLRKHVKVEAARFYYHCDRLGMLVWQDAVNGGRSYNANLVTNLPNIVTAVQSRIGDVSDREQRRLGRQDREGRDEYRRELREMIEELRFFPCICVWVPFNEGWGQFCSAEIAETVRQLDPGRLVDAASGWFDRGAGDLYSVHNYFRRLKIPAAKAAERAAALTEYGGLSRPVEGLTADNGMKAYRSLSTEAALTEAFVRLVRRDVVPQLANGLCAAVYTQLSDVEGEINGLFTYDRSLCKMDSGSVRAVAEEIRAAADKVRAEL